MATIKSEYYRFNGVSWDIHYFKTTMDMVDGLDTALAGKAASSHTHDDRYFTESEIQNSSIAMRRVTLNANNEPSSNLGAPSIPEMALIDEQFNNKIAFYPIANLKFYTSTDGITWTEYTTITDQQKRRFVGGDTNAGILIPNATAYFRIELVNDGNYVYLNALYFYWSSNGNSTKVKIRAQRGDGVWSQWTNSETSVSAWPGHLFLPFTTLAFHPSTTSTGHYRTVHIDFIPTWGGSNPIYLDRMQIWGGYPAGRRNIYSTDENKNVSFPANIFASGSLNSTSGTYDNNQRVYSPNNKPSLTDLGALIETNQKLLFGGTSQYIRLAYAGNTQAFIKHGADATEEELWHSGNFNPANYLSLSAGGTITGAISFNNIVYFTYGITVPAVYTDTISSDGGTVGFTGIDNVNFNQIDMVGVRGLYSETDAFQLSDENIPTLRCGPTGTGTFEVYGSIWTDGDITSKSRKVITEGPTAAKTANYTFVLGDANGFIYSNSASALTFTIPLNSSVEYPTGTEIHIMRYGTGEISISPTSGVTLVSEGSKRRINAQYQAASLKKLDTNTWVLIGALKS